MIELNTFITLLLILGSVTLAGIAYVVLRSVMTWEWFNVEIWWGDDK